MQTYAKQKQIHISSRKLGLVCDLIRGKKITEAQRILMVLDKKGAKIVLKLLNSSVANATNNFSMDINKLYVLNAIADQGTTLKRTLPKAKGSASVLRKRHSHLTITISDDKNDKLMQHKKISGKTKKIVKKNKKFNKTILANSSSNENVTLPEVETPIEQVSTKDEVKIASLIEEQEEKGGKK
ncbi:MAG: 50S ribosomal protein L22 [Mycoplasmataceae bacterium]|jgi:ribosomal protein L22|nr:50S ribosomal protein L22 [Mycoplasmataceae bacterium]